VRTVQGDAETAKSLLEHPWNHIFFTGGPSIGKTVMAAASKHLTSVTLELGGKSPVFLDPSFPVKRAAKLLAWAKSMNAGQICIAPDYVLVPREQMGDLVHAFAHALKDLYGDRLVDNPDYTRIINERHWARLQAWHEDAVGACAQVWQPEPADVSKRFFPPTLYLDPNPSCSISCEEIFGPLLPLIPYDKLEDAIAYVNAKERPLVTYVLSENKAFQERTVNETRAGATVVNDFIIHYMHHDLPFGGVNHSGIGKSHGIWGFREFTNARPVVRRRWGVNPTLFLGPPYTNWKKQVVSALLRWL
jgi:aldehyde dehydrogenase (NAD+)